MSEIDIRDIAEAICECGEENLDRLIIYNDDIVCRKCISNMMDQYQSTNQDLADKCVTLLSLTVDLQRQINLHKRKRERRRKKDTKYKSMWDELTKWCGSIETIDFEEKSDKKNHLYTLIKNLLKKEMEILKFKYHIR